MNTRRKILLFRGKPTPADTDSFILQIDTTLGDCENRMRLPIQGTDMVIDWGDGTIETVTQTDEPSSDNWVTHNYAEGGVFTVKVSNSITRIRFAFQGDRLKPVKGLQWGTAVWGSVAVAFRSCENLVGEFSDVPDLSNISSTILMFGSATSFNQDVGNWSVSNITLFNNMFRDATSFNQSLENWQLRLGGVNMTSMLDECGMNTVNYSRTLIGWANYVHANSGMPSGAALGALGMTYDNTVYTGIGSGHFTDAVTARAYLTSTATWTITGDSDVS